MLPAAAIIALVAVAPLTEEELRPVPSGEGAGAGAALAAGHADEALRLLAGSELPQARFLRALALARSGRPLDALAALEGIEGALPELADRVELLRGKVLSALGRPGEAAQAWGKVPSGSAVADEAAVARGRALAAAGEVERALEALRPIGERAAPADLSQEDRAATALAAAGALQTPRDPLVARTSLLSCWSDHPLAPESDGCLSALRRLPGAAGLPPTDLQETERAERLLEANRNRAAIATLERLLPRAGAVGPEGALACRVRSALGRAHRKERQLARAIELLRPVVDRCTEPRLRLRSLFVLAGAVAIAGDREEAVGLYRKLAEEYPESSLADDALVSAADLLERLGRGEEALRLFQAAAAVPGGGDRRAEALFRLAWAARRSGALEEAAKRFVAIEEEFRDADPYEHARAAYWRARTLAPQGEAGRAAAVALWEELVHRYPVDWYGLLSRARLAAARGEAADALPRALGEESPPLRLDPGPLAPNPHFRAALALLRMGLRAEAGEELRAIDLAGLRAPGASVEPLFVVAALMDRAGDHRSAHGILKTDGRAVLRSPPHGDAVRLWRIAYPDAFRQEVVRWATAARVPADLLQALMREESALDPAVVSPAGAVGLTQLMPATAAAVAKRLGMGPITPTSLMDPVTNLRVGAAYLGELLARYGRQPALALAAYNAGGGALARWMEARGGLELDEFVEEIPIDETRGYVKRVLRTFAAYRLLSDQPAGEPLDLLPRVARAGAHSEAISVPVPAATGFGLPRRSD